MMTSSYRKTSAFLYDDVTILSFLIAICNGYFQVVPTGTADVPTGFTFPIYRLSGKATPAPTDSLTQRPPPANWNFSPLFTSVANVARQAVGRIRKVLQKSSIAQKIHSMEAVVEFVFGSFVAKQTCPGRFAFGYSDARSHTNGKWYYQTAALGLLDLYEKPAGKIL